MPYDPSVDIDIIRTNLLGEEVRDAIVRLFRTVEQASVAVTLTLTEYNALTEEEKNNGTLYFISDMNITDGETTYIDSVILSTSHVIITIETALAIVDAIKKLIGINGGVMLPDIPNMITEYEPAVKRKWHVLSACYNYNNTWAYSNADTKPYVVDVYPVKAGIKYFVFSGAISGDIFNATFFTIDPMTLTQTNNSGTTIIRTSTVHPFNVYAFTPSVDGFITITSSSQADEDVETFVIGAEHLNRLTKISYGKPYDDDEVDEEEEEEP